MIEQVVQVVVSYFFKYFQSHMVCKENFSTRSSQHSSMDVLVKSSYIISIPCFLFTTISLVRGSKNYPGKGGYIKKNHATPHFRKSDDMLGFIEVAPALHF